VTFFAVLLPTLLLGATSSSPVAVAPFQNLNDDGALRWLEQGAAETVRADLKKSGVDVVERGAFVAAIARVQAPTDVERAVAAGKIVGVKSIVLGSFQTSGAGRATQIRLVGRVVDVEMGVVADAAKVTGALDDIFALQDQVVSSLAGRAGKKPRPRPKVKPGVLAYERYAVSLDAPDDATRRALLDEALRLDPGLVYARDDLAALEARLRTLAKTSEPAFDAREGQLLAIVDDDKQPADRRREAARVLLDTLSRARRFHALARASERVLRAHVPADVLVDVDELASSLRVLALARLVKVDNALQAAEKHLASFPAGAHRAEVDALVRELVDERRTLPERRSEYEAELRELAVDVAEAKKRGPLDDEHELSFAWKPCIAAKWSRLPDEMVTRCARFLDGRAPNEHTAYARAFVAWGHALRGEMDDARAIAEKLEAEVPGSLDATGLREVMVRWSTD
jgi:TolB-like protein